jgi:uncharacterized protein
MIDAHVHVVPPNLPGVGRLSPLLDGPPDVLIAVLTRHLQEAGFSHVLAMGSWGGGPDDPLGVAATLRIGRAVPGVLAVGVADPTRSDPDHLRRVDAALATGQVRALKGYLGYLHYAPDHPGYRPYYERAARHNLPFVFHTGDT